MSAVRRYRTLLPYVRRRWRALAAIVALTFVASAATALQPWPMKLLVDHALGDTAAPGFLVGLLRGLGVEPTAAALVALAAVASLFVYTVNAALEVGLGLAWARAGQRMTFDLSADVFRRLLQRSPTYHTKHGVGDGLVRVSEDVYGIYTLTEALLITPVQQVVTVLTLGVVAFQLDPLLAGVTFGVAPLMGASALYFGRRMKRRARETREIRSRILRFVHQTLWALPLVQAHTAETRNRQTFDALAEDAAFLSQRGAFLKGAYGLLNGLVTTLGTAIVLFVGGSRVLAGTLTLGSLLVFLAYLKSIQGAFRGLLATYGSLRVAEASLDRVVEVLEGEDEVADAPDARTLSPVRPGETAHLRLEGVTFGYEPERPVLTDVDLDLAPGTVTALVGSTGAGKSTVAGLVGRFVDPWKGRVTLDGQDVKTLTLDSVRARVAVVFQEPFLLPLSVRETIRYGRPEATQAEVEAAARAAQAAAFVEALPEGYDTVLGERGVTLSGGQRQRLAIARALLLDAPILVLDEPTSALDVETEAALVAALERGRANRAVLLIAHRLSTVRHADRIFVLEDGRVVEQGSHDDLLARGGRYRALHDLQTAGAGARS